MTTPRDPRTSKPHSKRHLRRVLGGTAIAAACLILVPAVAEGAGVTPAEIAREEKVLVSEIHLPTFIAQHAVKDTQTPKIHQTQLHAQAAAKAKAEAAKKEAKAQSDAQDAQEREAAVSQRAATPAATPTPAAAPAPASSHTFTVVMGSSDRASLQTQVFSSTEPVDATAFYGTPWIVWDRTKGGLTFPQTPGTIVHLTGAVSGTYRVDGLIEYINADTPITEIARGRSLTFQVCDPVYGHNRMHIVGLTELH